MPLDVTPWQHDHIFDRGNPLGEKNTWRVVILTAVMMFVEIAAGMWYGSQALAADGWHLGTHLVALGTTALSYVLARRYSTDPRFAFGTWKMEVLGGFTSAIILGLVALLIVVEAVRDLIHPEPIQFNEAIFVAVLGLVVNLVSAFLLSGQHAHCPGTAHEHDHQHAHHDLNLRAAYIHIVADAFTAFTAVAALLGGKFLGWNWLDPVMAMVGAIVILVWSFTLLRDTSRILLDSEMDIPLVRDIRHSLESDGETQVADLHVWRVGRAHFACLITVVARQPRALTEYQGRLREHREIAHLTIEIVQATGSNPLSTA